MFTKSLFIYTRNYMKELIIIFLSWREISSSLKKKKIKSTIFNLSFSETDTKGAFCFQSLTLSREKKFGAYWGWRVVFIKRKGLHWENERERVKENYRDVTIYLPDGMAYAFETVYVLNEWVWPLSFWVLKCLKQNNSSLLKCKCGKILDWLFSYVAAPP